MKAGSEAWFMHVLALALGRTIAELQAAMTHREFRSWRAFYRMYPFDDFHRFHRPAAMIAGAMSGGEDALKSRLEWLSPSHSRPSGVDDDDPISTALGVTR